MPILCQCSMLTTPTAFSYIASRVYLHNPPGENNALTLHPDAPEELKHEEHHLLQEEPRTNPWACAILLILTVGIMAATAEFVSTRLSPKFVLKVTCGQLVESIEGVREISGIQEE